MQLRMWMYDLAREQAPTDAHLAQIARMTEAAGYNALGLYLEHRFAYPSIPWAHGTGCMTPEMARMLQDSFPNLKIIPFINLCGHFEGMIYTEEGKQYREEMFAGLQADPSNPAFVSLCERLIDDTLAAFDSDIIHIGGDETFQLGACSSCKARVEAWERGENVPEAYRHHATVEASQDGALYGSEAGVQAGKIDGKAILYGTHFGPLAERVKRAGRRPAVWGDMFLQHPGALGFMPTDTLMFDWQYFKGVSETAPTFQSLGFEVVGSPAIQTYNATWCHMDASESNIRQVAEDVEALGLYGVCITTWECGLFGAYDTLFPALAAAGAVLQNPDHDPDFFAAYDDVSARHGAWARLMARGLGELGGTFTPGRIRSSLKVRLMLNANPFFAWMHHGEEYSGPVGDAALALFEQALFQAPTDAEQGVTLFARGGVEFVRLAEQARQLYAAGQSEAAIGKLGITRKIFDDLANVAKRTHDRIGGSLADIERCRVAKAHVETVMQRIRTYGDGSLGYLPAFEILTHPKFIPHDQASWWLINKWAHQ